MALLGNGGILELSREWPLPMALAFEAINLAAFPRSINLNNEDYWTGDRVWLYFPGGSPYQSGNAPGRGMYFGGIFDLSSSKSHVSALDDQYYQVNNNVLFYDNTPAIFFENGYIRIDELGRIRLFKSEISAYNSVTADEIPLQNVKTGNFVVARYSESGIYTDALVDAGAQVNNLTLPNESQELKAVITPPPGFAAIADNPAERGWLFQCELEEWSLDIDASSLDMTAIGEKFGEQTKSLVRGAGALQFLVDFKVQPGEQDAVTLLRLVLLTREYCKSNAKFYLFKNRIPVENEVGGSIYYNCDLLLTNSRLNIRAGDLIAGTADFVVTGEIEVRVAE